MSHLYVKPTRNKPSTSRRFRVACAAPYNVPSDEPRGSSMLLAGTSSVSGSTLDKRTQEVRDAYESSLKDYTPANQQDIAAVREDIEWAASGMRGESAVTNDDAHNNDGPDDDWVDDDDYPLRFLSIPANTRAAKPSLSQSWSECLAREKYSWDREMPALCEALLAFTRTGPLLSPPDDQTSTRSFSLLCIHLTALQKITFTAATIPASIVQTLIHNRYIPPTPSNPSLAIHVDVLCYCAALRRHTSIVSLQNITSAICEVHNTLYTWHLRTQLSAALDVYLALDRMMEARLAKALSRDDLDWRMANACAACSYSICLQDEPKMKYSKQVTCDGNDSLKCLGNASVADTRTFEHSYFLDNDYVDHFENEVKRKGGSKNAKAGQATDNAPEPQSDGSDELCTEVAVDGTATADSTGTGSEENNLPCDERWKNEHANNRSGKPLVVFDETGIFVVSCRHGTVILVEDMWRSSELSKYSLAAVDKLAQVFGDSILIGYDIGCTFCITALNSKLVGSLLARKYLIEFAVGSFHGYTHERKCQVENHPTYIEGAGLELFEQNEQLFSSTNDVARTTRHASGSVLKARYKRALGVLDTLPNEIKTLYPDMTDDDWRAMFEAECKYLKAVEAPSYESTLAMVYLQKLFKEVYSITVENLTPAQFEVNRPNPALPNTGKQPNSYDRLAAQTRKLEARRAAASEQLAAAQVKVAKLEEKYEIFPHWTPNSPEWKAAEERECYDHYYEKLQNLESLVVQRLAELEKAHLMGTSYNARKQINQAITCREKTIHNALEVYNEAAPALSPPLPTLTFKELTDCVYVAELDFLKYSEHGAQDAEWAQPGHWRCVTAWHKIQRAKEEIVWLNVEVRCIYTHIRDEAEFLLKHHQLLSSSNPDLAHSLLAQIRLNTQANRRILRNLDSISKLQGFSGDLRYGVRANHAPTPEPEPDANTQQTQDAPLLVNALGQLVLGNDDDPVANPEDGEPSDEAVRVMTGVEETCLPM